MLRLAGQTQSRTAAHINLPSSSLILPSQLPSQVVYIYNQTAPIAATISSPLSPVITASANLESPLPVATIAQVKQQQQQKKNRKPTNILPHHTAPAPAAMPHSHSSSDSSVERVYYDPRREARKRDKRSSGGRREVVVHNHKTPSGDEPLRRSDMMANKWK